MKFATKSIHAGNEPEEKTGAVIPPIFMTSTYAQEAPAEHKGYDYTRAGNPNFTVAEAQLSALEFARYATVFSSGLGALTAYLSTLKQGDRIVAMDGLYGGTFRLIDKVFKKFGLEYTLVNPSETDRLISLLESGPELFLLESPTNPLLDIHDIRYLTKIAKSSGTITIVDNTFATPYFQNPLTLGADIVWHSCTKYLGGHSDVIGGAMMTNDAGIDEALKFARMAIGVNPSPMDVWLLSRSLKTLAVRMEKHQENALAISHFLSDHPLVKKVYYPGLTGTKNHEKAKKQMSGFSGIVSVEFALPIEETKKLISSFDLFLLAESLGGVESLVDHPASMTHASIPKEEREKMGLSDGLVRFSVGIEDIEDLISDLKKAIEKSQHTLAAR
ncbi:MAG: PLP-dependent aspartate aminotransferase family protein [Chlamydiota bacterium]